MEAKYILIVAYGDEAYEIQEEHEGEEHTAQEWYEIYSKPWKNSKYNPTEILEFKTEHELLSAKQDPGAVIPKYYQYEGIIDSDYSDFGVKVRDKEGHVAYVTYVDDCEDNTGGFYCETYADDCGERKIDDFCIHPEDIPGLEDMGWREQEAAIEGYIRNFYRDEVLDLDYNFHNF